MVPQGGYPEAQFQLGCRYYAGGGDIKEDLVQAAVWYQRAAASRHAEAQYRLGTMYQYGEGVKQDTYKASAYFQEAAASGYRPAQFKMGCMYKNGTGVLKDEAKSSEWFQKANDPIISR